MLDRDDIIAKLLALTRETTFIQPILIIGGAAIALKYNHSYGTSDIDAVAGTPKLREAARRAGITEISLVSVWDGPYLMEDRFTQVTDIPGITINVPDPNDLFLMKVCRGSDKDTAGFNALVERGLIDPKVLVSRYLTEMSHVIGDMTVLRGNLRAALKAHFGITIELPVHGMDTVDEKAVLAMLGDDRDR